MGWSVSLAAYSKISKKFIDLFFEIDINYKKMSFFKVDS